MIGLPPRTPALQALAIFAVASAVIAAAWSFQALGFLPCDLCYWQRKPYYVGAPLALILAALGRFAPPSAGLRAAFGVLALIFAVGCGLAVYHSGVELKLWSGPVACSGSALGGLDNGADLLSQLETVKVARCDEPSLRILGFTFANWNILISAALAGFAAFAALAPRRAG